MFILMHMKTFFVATLTIDIYDFAPFPTPYFARCRKHLPLDSLLVIGIDPPVNVNPLMENTARRMLHIVIGIIIP